MDFSFESEEKRLFPKYYIGDGFACDFESLRRIYVSLSNNAKFSMKTFTEAWHQVRFYELVWGGNHLDDRANFLAEIYEPLTEMMDVFLKEVTIVRPGFFDTIHVVTEPDRDPFWTTLTCRKVYQDKFKVLL